MTGLLGDETGAGRKPYVAPRQVTLAEDVRRLGGLLSSLIPDPFQHGSLSGAARNTARALQGGHYKVEYGPNGEVYQTDEWIPYDGGGINRLFGVNPLLEFAGGAGVAAPLAKVPKGALMAFGDVGNIRGKHASPHKFDKFDLSKIGTGEGARAYGHGGYLSTADAVHDEYMRSLSPRREISVGGDVVYDGVNFGEISNAEKTLAAEISDRATRLGLPIDEITIGNMIEDKEAVLQKVAQSGDFDTFKEIQDQITALKRWRESGINVGDLKTHAYEVELDAQPHEMLDWDKPLSEQPKAVQDAVGDRLERLRQFSPSHVPKDPSGDWLYKAFGPQGGLDKWDGGSSVAGLASKALREKGIKGIRYLDGNSRGAGEGTYNYVFFDDKDALIHTRDGEPIKGLLAD